MWNRVIPGLTGFLAVAVACGPAQPDAKAPAGAAAGAPAPASDRVQAFVGARIFSGTGQAPIERGAILVQNGRIAAIGTMEEVAVPGDADTVDVSGKTIVPGLINAHGHVGDTLGLASGHYSKENVLRQLALYARYGITTVVSLGLDREPGVAVRRAQDSPDLERARLFVAGRIVDAETPEAARQQVDANVAMGVDFIKIRVDDNLGTTEKMPSAVYNAVIAQSHQHGLRLTSHMFYLDDAKALLRAGTDFLAHSVRDRPVDDEFIALVKEKGICYCPTLTREVSTFVYEDVPAFFADPFFANEVDPEIIAALKDPARQAKIRASKAAQAYKKALEMALANLKTLSDAGVPIAFGTDSGPPTRFQGFFEHLELELMAQAGLSPQQILVSATSMAARCLGLEQVGVLHAGNWADFVVLAADPLADIGNLRRIDAVWIAGNRVPRR